MRGKLNLFSFTTALVAFLGFGGVAFAAGSGVVQETLNLTKHWGGYVALIVFVVAYVVPGRKPPIFKKIVTAQTQLMRMTFL